MKAIDFYKYCKNNGTWVDWNNTKDVFIHGDPETKIKGIAVTWLATNAVLKKAAKLGLDFVIAHEGVFYSNFTDFQSEKQHHKSKHALMDKLGIVLMRCHDTWDRMPEYGVRDSWAKFLNFIPEHCDVNSFYRTSKVDNMTVITIAQKICEKTSEFGQRTIKMIAKNPQKKIKRIVTGTGAITELPKMYETGAELIVATDDGIHTTYCGLWSLDLDIPVIVVDHAVAELPAIVTLAEFIKQKFPAVPVEYLPGEFPADEIITKI